MRRLAAGPVNSFFYLFEWGLTEISNIGYISSLQELCDIHSLLFNSLSTSNESGILTNQITSPDVIDSLPVTAQAVSSPRTNVVSGISIETPKMSLNQMTTYHWSLLDEVTQYQSAGIEAIGLWRPKLTDFGEEKAVELIRESGLSVSNVSWAGGFTGTNEYSIDESLEDARDAIRLSAELNAECLMIASGSRSGHTVNHARRLVVSALQELGEFAGEYGVTLAVQPMRKMFARDWTFLNTLDQALDLLDSIGLQNVKLGFDVYHLWQESNIVGRIAEFADSIATVQLSDWHVPTRSEQDRCLPGDGIIPLAAIVQSLLENGYQGSFDVLIWSEELWKTDHEQLMRDCQSRFHSLFASSKLGGRQLSG